MLDRTSVVDLVNGCVLGEAAARYGTLPSELRLYGDYLGCQNIVYDYSQGGQPMILRISYRPDRSLALIQAEVDFINYLHSHGVRVSKAVPSFRGKLVESIEVDGWLFNIVSFIKAKGKRVPDNQYRYRPGVSIDEYCQNWGQALGLMHRLTRTYQPTGLAARRPDWLAWHGHERVDQVIPESLPVARQRCHALINSLQQLPKPSEVYGLIHADFNDGNFTVDYSNGDITVFDFDDCCYGWFVYELASAWEGGIGRTMFEPDAGQRRAYMDHYFGQVMAGYQREVTLPAAWIELLPAFIKVIEMETLVEILAYWIDRGAIPHEAQGRLAYLVRCIEDELPYMGFYEPIYSPAKPFELEGRIL